MKQNNIKKLGSYLAIIVIIAAMGLLLFTTAKKVESPSNEIETTETTTVVDPKNEINIKASEDIDLVAMQDKYKNKDIIGRLEVPDLFNILVVQGKDNTFYLDHSIKKKSDKKGTEFIDYRNTVKDKQINIYGHNSRTYDIPFRKLEAFKKKDFFDKNEYIILQTLEGKRIYHILAIKEVSGAFEHMKITKTGKDFVEHVDILKQGAINSRDLKYDENSNILVLQTCSYGKKKTYYVITAIEIEGYTS